MPKDATKKPPTAVTTDQQEPEEQIRLRAYELHEARGRQDGHEREDWFRAKKSLQSTNSEPPPPNSNKYTTVIGKPRKQSGLFRAI